MFDGLKQNTGFRICTKMKSCCCSTTKMATKGLFRDQNQGVERGYRRASLCLKMNGTSSSPPWPRSHDSYTADLTINIQSRAVTRSHTIQHRQARVQLNLDRLKLALIPLPNLLTPLYIYNPANICSDFWIMKAAQKGPDGFNKFNHGTYGLFKWLSLGTTTSAVIHFRRESKNYVRIRRGRSKYEHAI